jgi:hypothetical protein
MSDYDVRWIAFDGNAWSAENQFPNHQSATGPALALLNNALYCAHRGGNDSAVWVSSFDGTAWSVDNPISNYHSAAAPALAAVNGKLYCAYRGE